MDMVYSDIFKSIKTTNDSQQLLNEIDILASSLFQVQNQGFEQNLKSIRINTANYLRESFTNLTHSTSSGLMLSEAEALNDRDKINNFLIKLKEELRAQKILKISLAFEPSQNLIDDLFTWVLKNLKAGIILNINTDKSIIGGAIIEFEGKYKDLTLKKKLEEVFENKREEILDTVR